MAAGALREIYKGHFVEFVNENLHTKSQDS
jgi:hypothetical protein